METFKHLDRIKEDAAGEPGNGGARQIEFAIEEEVKEAQV